MAIELFVTIRSITGTATTITVEVAARHLASGREVATSFTVARSTVTPANVVSGLKTQVISWALAHYGAVITAPEILVFGAPQ